MSQADTKYTSTRSIRASPIGLELLRALTSVESSEISTERSIYASSSYSSRDSARLHVNHSYIASEEKSQSFAF